MYPFFGGFWDMSLSTMWAAFLIATAIFYELCRKKIHRLGGKRILFDQTFLPLLFLSLWVGRYFELHEWPIRFVNGTWDAVYFSQWFSFWDMSLNWYGMTASLIIGILGVAFFYKESLTLWLDSLTWGFPPAAMLLFATGYFTGVGFGTPTTETYGVIINSDQFPLSGVPLIPLQLYYALVCFICFCICYKLFRGKETNFTLLLPKQGFITSWIFACFFLCSAVLELFRDSPAEIASIPQNVVISWLLWVWFLLWNLWIRLPRNDRKIPRYILLH